MPDNVAGPLPANTFKPRKAPAIFEGYDKPTWDIIKSWRSILASNVYCNFSTYPSIYVLIRNNKSKFLFL